MAVKLSFVIPVYNGAESIMRVVDDIESRFRSIEIEIILVNDGSKDRSEEVCRELANRKHVVFLQLAKNFGEHSAVLAGLNQSSGAYVAVLDDDGQNPPREILKLLGTIENSRYDVVYGRYVEKKHHFLRNFGSKFNDSMANVMLKKPKNIYLSSFKIMNRFIVDEIIKYKGSFPYIDGLIFRTTANIHQIDVVHEDRMEGTSGYTLKKLIYLWMNMFFNFSIRPLRLTVLLGLATSLVGLIMMIVVIIERLLYPNFPVGLASIMVGIIFFSGIQLLILGTIGEYLGRLFLDHSGTPQYVVRYKAGE